MTTTNQQLRKGIETNLPILNNNIKDGITEYKNYLEGLKDEKFEEKLNETEDDAIKRAESISDRLDEMIKRNELSNKKAKDIIELLKKMTDLFNGIVNNTDIEKKKLAVRNNELIDIIIDLERRKTDKLIDQNPKKKKGLNGDFEDKEDEWKEHRITTKENSQKQVIVPIAKPSVNNLGNNEMKQLEEWSGMKIGNIIFDSDVDNWKQGTSVFDQKIINKSNLIFLIEDDDGNRFGGCIKSKIGCVGEWIWIKDSEAFLFSLKSNGRLNGMLKFDNGRSQYLFVLSNKSDGCLFAIGQREYEVGCPVHYSGSGSDIYICKENNKNQSDCCQESFHYKGIQNALCGKEEFTPKRITVIQLI